MLDALPSEVIEQILGHLPTAASIVNVACTNKKLYTIVSDKNYGIFRDFVQKAFPSIRTPPLWRDMARTLTFRSRAWDRRAFIARECAPPREDNNGPNWLDLSSKFGFVPVIDSYEEFPGTTITQKREVLAFGAAGRLRIRTIENGCTKWQSLRFEDDHLPQYDVVDVKLLRPHQRQPGSGETVILRRANMDIIKVVASPEDGVITQTAKFTATSSRVQCNDVSNSTDPLLVVCDTRSLQLFRVNTPLHATSAYETLPLTSHSTLKYRQRCVKFLTADTIAVASQYIEGRERAPLVTYRIDSGGQNLAQTQCCTFSSENYRGGRHSASTIVKLDDASNLSGHSGQLFLSGWTDGAVRLHDLRTPQSIVAEYFDHVDDGQIMSIVAYGHEKFFAGSHQNACLKMFDLRISGARKYSYLDTFPAKTFEKATIKKSPVTPANAIVPFMSTTQRDINIFLALTVNRGGQLWQPLPSRHESRVQRYRGSVYSLSAPSSSSPTLYAGIENHVIQLDFVCTDDMNKNSAKHVDPGLKLNNIDANDILDLSCYERPREGFEATDAVLLYKQLSWQETVRGVDHSHYGGPEEGWDERWRSASTWKRQVASHRWRRGQQT